MSLSLGSSVRAAGLPRNTQAPVATPGLSCVVALGRIEWPPFAPAPGHPCSTPRVPRGQGDSGLPSVSGRKDRLLPATFDPDATDAPGCTTLLPAYFALPVYRLLLGARAASLWCRP